MEARRQFFGYISKQEVDANGVNDAWDVTTISRAKIGSTIDDGNPLLIANEWICSNLGLGLRLPIPPCALLRRGHEKVLFANLHFGGDSTPDDADPVQCVKALPDLCIGILTFDVWIANTDRHEGNLKVDRTIAPSELYVYDHDHALLGCLPGEELKAISDLWNRLGITEHCRAGGGNRHVFLDLVSDPSCIYQWCAKIASIPEFFIHQLCHEVVGLGITREQAEATTKFLVHRKNSLFDIIIANKHEFKAVPAHGWWLLA